MASRYFDDFEVGDRLDTHGRTLTEADVANFAGVTGDINPIHMDAVYASKTRFGRRVPHGQLVFVLALGLAERVIAPLFHDSIVAFYGVDKMRFISPVFIGDTIRLERRVAALEQRDAASGLLTFEDHVINQDGETCLRYEPKYILKVRPDRTNPASGS